MLPPRSEQGERRGTIVLEVQEERDVSRTLRKAAHPSFRLGGEFLRPDECGNRSAGSAVPPKGRVRQSRLESTAADRSVRPTCFLADAI
jgi:hypothetical protein